MPIDLGSNALTSNNNAPVLKRPIYLVVLADGVGKTAAISHFIATDKPEYVNGFVSVKGIDTSATEEEIIKGFTDILSKTPKEQTVEILFPVHRVKYIRSLVYNAVKTAQTIPVSKE